MRRSFVANTNQLRKNENRTTKQNERKNKTKQSKCVSCLFSIVLFYFVLLFAWNILIQTQERFGIGCCVCYGSLSSGVTEGTKPKKKKQT